MHQASLVVSYLIMLLNKLEWEDSFYSQVRVIESLANILAELGDERARSVAEEAVRFEAEAYLLDLWLKEIREQLLSGQAIDFPSELKERMVRLRRVLERFKANLIVSLDERLGKRAPVVVVGEGGEK